MSNILEIKSLDAEDEMNSQTVPNMTAELVSHCVPKPKKTPDLDDNYFAFVYMLIFLSLREWRSFSNMSMAAAVLARDLFSQAPKPRVYLTFCVSVHLVHSFLPILIMN